MKLMVMTSQNMLYIYVCFENGLHLAFQVLEEKCICDFWNLAVLLTANKNFSTTYLSIKGLSASLSNCTYLLLESHPRLTVVPLTNRAAKANTTLAASFANRAPNSDKIDASLVCSIIDSFFN
jgi:hypothetical protein